MVLHTAVIPVLQYIEILYMSRIPVSLPFISLDKLFSEKTYTYTSFLRGGWGRLLIQDPREGDTVDTNCQGPLWLGAPAA